MSTRILLRLSLVVSRTRPSVMERLGGEAAPVCSSPLEQLLRTISMGVSFGRGTLAGAVVSNSLGELNKGNSLNGVLLKLKVV